jgi:Eukaryotic aspartyl protease
MVRPQSEARSPPARHCSRAAPRATQHSSKPARPAAALRAHPPPFRAMGAIRVAAAACALAWLAAVHADAGTPVLHAALDAQAPAAFGAGRATRGFHESVFVHAALEDFPEVGVPVAVRARSVGRSAVDGFHVVELFGGMVKVGEYYAKIKLGGQMVRTQIDTGSATLAAPMAGCKSCLAGDRRYDLKKSAGGKGAAVACGDGDLCMENKCSPFSCGKCSDAKACCSKTEPDMCGFHLSFGDGSGAQGMLVKDDMEWGGVTFPVVFGGINKDSPDFERQEVDGILGMAYPTLACNPSCVKPTFESMVDHLKMKSVFQVCITSDAGRIVLGDWDKSLMQKEPVWVDMHLSSPPTYYTVQLSGDLMVNDRPVEFPKYKLAIADSGTTLIVFTRRSFELLVDHLQQHYCDVPGLCGANTWFRPAHCTKISEADRRKLPTLRFALVGGFVIELTSDDYLINYESKGPDFWCVGLMALDALSGGIDVIFGNTVMKKYVTIYGMYMLPDILIYQSRGLC